MTFRDRLAFLGGDEVFGREVSSEVDLAAEVARGLPSASLGHLVIVFEAHCVPAAVYECGRRVASRGAEATAPLAAIARSVSGTLARVTVRGHRKLRSHPVKNRQRERTVIRATGSQRSARCSAPPVDTTRSVQSTATTGIRPFINCGNLRVLAQPLRFHPRTVLVGVLAAKRCAAATFSGVKPPIPRLWARGAACRHRPA